MRLAWTIMLFGWIAGATELKAPSPPIYGATELKAPSPPIYGAYAIRCTCDTTKSFAPSVEAANLLLSVNPVAISHWLDLLNPVIPGNATFLCKCAQQPVPGGSASNYILTANQTNTTAVSASDCLGVELLTEICQGLNVLSLFQCETVWRSGVSGIVANNLSDLQVLLTAVERLCASRGGDCARTVRFQVLEDAVLASTHY